MKFKALPIKKWIISQISPLGWTFLIGRALPELMECNPNFTGLNISKRTLWSQQEVDIIQIYLRRLYQQSIPDDVLYANGELEVNYMELVGINFMQSAPKWNSIKQSIKRLFNINDRRSKTAH